MISKKDYVATKVRVQVSSGEMIKFLKEIEIERVNQVKKLNIGITSQE